MGLSGSGDGQSSRQQEADAVGPQEATAPAQARGTPSGPPQAPPHWAILYLIKDGNPHRFRRQTQEQALVRVQGGLELDWWGNALICPESQIRVPVSTLPGSRSPCPPSQGQGPRVRPPTIKIPTHKPPSHNKMEQSPSNPGKSQVLTLHTGDSDTSHPSRERRPGLAVPELHRQVPPPAQAAPPCHLSPPGPTGKGVTGDSAPGHHGLMPRG